MKIMNLPECDKLVYTGGVIARQIGTMFVVDDEDPMGTESYPILSGGRKTADGWLTGDSECYDTPVVCSVGEKITPRLFAKYVKRGMHEEVPTSAWELYWNLRDNGGDIQLPILARTKETIRRYKIDLEFNDFDKDAYCYSSDTSDFYFEAYYDRDNKDEVFRELQSQLMDYLNILDTEDLYCQIVFTTDDIDNADVVKRLNTLEIDTRYCNMYKPR